MATVAVGLSVHNITAQSHKCTVLSNEVQRDGSNSKTLLNLGFFAVAIIRLDVPGTGDQHG